MTVYLQDKTHLKSYKATAEHLAAIAWAYIGRPMSDLPDVAKDIAANKDSVREGKKVTDATVRNRLACLKAACRWAWKKHGLTESDPTGRMQMPTVKNERHVYVRRETMLQLARRCWHHQTRVAIRAAFYTGMRLGELYSAEVDGAMLVLHDTKNGDRRSVPAHPRIHALLKHLPLSIKETTLQKDFRRARDALGLGDLRFHDLRHSAASEMVNAGVDLYTVGTVLGHRDPRSTQRYSHLTAGRLADAIGRIGKKSPHKEGATAKKKAAQGGSRGL